MANVLVYTKIGSTNDMQPTVKSRLLYGSTELACQIY